MTFTVSVWLLTAAFLAWSRAKDPAKTRQGLAKAWKSLDGILPDFMGVILLISLGLTLLSPETISRLIGGQTGFWGMLLTSLIGAITLIPGFIAFPLARSLAELGAGVRQIAVFISTLMMVGVVTAPMEMKYFGKKATLLRNLLAYVLSFVVAFAVGGVVAR